MDAIDAGQEAMEVKMETETTKGETNPAVQTEPQAAVQAEPQAVAEEPLNDTDMMDEDVSKAEDAIVVPSAAGPAPDAPSTAQEVSGDSAIRVETAPVVAADAQDSSVVAPVQPAAEPVAPTLPTDSAPEAAENTERKRLEDDARAYLVEQTHEVVIPSYSAWFDMTEVHELERKSVPEFFNGRNRSKTPTVYKDYRDFMINTYRLNPVEYLTVTACRRNLAGDVCAIMRVHAFLEQWGLINYQINPDTRPSSIGPPFTGHFRVIADTPRGLQPFQPAPASRKSSGRPLEQTDAAINTADRTVSEAQLELRRNVYSAPGAASTSTTDARNGAIDGSNNTFNCYSCGVDCSRVRFHGLKQEKYDLCPNCYNEGRFPSTSHSGDFVRLESGSIKQEQDDWSDQETLLMLEALEMYDEDWIKVAQHVGTRTKEQCVMHFLQLPIEDAYVDGASAGPLQYARQPTSQTDNPVMSVVAFLAATVQPDVAAASAQQSIEALKASLAASDPTATGANGGGANGSAVANAAAAALGTIAAKAHLLGTHEERHLTKLFSTAVALQLEKLELKVSQFEELENALERDRRALELAQQQVYLDRLGVAKERAMMASRLVEIERRERALEAAAAQAGNQPSAVTAPTPTVTSASLQAPTTLQSAQDALGAVDPANTTAPSQLAAEAAEGFFRP